MPEKCTGIINLRYPEGSVGSSSNPDLFNRQNFEQLKQMSLRRKSLFVDTTFPPDTNSLGQIPGMQQWQQRQVKWLRPADIAKQMGFRGEVSFLIDGASRLDFGQGQIGNCWFLAAIGSLTLHKELLVQVVPCNQSFEEYAGIFHFRFWRFGRWVDVVIDDFLPTFQNQLLSVNSKTGNEYWIPLLEKAYAKLCGSYADMHAGNPSEAFKDFCGGVFMNYKLRDQHDRDHEEELWASLSRATDCKSMIGCGTFAAGGSAVNTVAMNGLVDWHAYAVTGVTEVTRYGSSVRLIRLLNPWGHQEWNGKWSDKSDLWNQVSSEDKAKCVKSENGEFWMELEDFCHHFNYMSICCENPNFLDGDLNCQWKCMSYNGSWIAGKTAGGGIREPTFDMNPQFRIKVKAEEGGNKGNNNLLLSLMRRPLGHRTQASGNYIGFSIFKVEEWVDAGKLAYSYLKQYLQQQSPFTNDREVMELIKVEPGEYVVVPHTMYPNGSDEFLLSVYTKAGVKVQSVGTVEFTNFSAERLENMFSGNMSGGHVKVITETTSEELFSARSSGHDAGDHHEHGDHGEEPAEEVTPTPTAGEDESSEMSKLFKQYSDRNKDLSITQLQRLLNHALLNGKQNGFDLTTCRSLVAFSNPQGIQGKIDYPAFVKLWEKCVSYKELFHRFDVDGSEALSLNETMNGVLSRGTSVDPHTIVMLVFRYSGFTRNVPLEGFVPLMLQLESNNNQNNMNQYDYFESNFEADDGFSTISIFF